MRTTDGESISEQAAEWFLTLPEADAEQRREFAQWLKQSPLHVNEFLLMTALDRRFEGFDPQKEIPVDALAHAQIIQLGELPRTSPSAIDTFSNARQPWRAGIAAMLGIAALGAWWLWMPQSGVQRFATDVGEQRAFEMPDGSVIHLNTGSQVEVNYTDQDRQVRLVRGQALFRVTRDPSRPFRVLTERSAIQVLGTQFDVYRHAAGDTTVSVLEGKVRIDPARMNQTGLNQNRLRPTAASAPAPALAPSPLAKRATAAPAKTTTSPMEGESPVLTAGEQVRISPDGEVTPTRAADLQEMSVWRQRRLVFRKQTLAEVAEEFNRYNKDTLIRVEGEAANMRLTGVFDADDPHSLLQFLAADTHLRLLDQGATLIIQPQ